MTTSHTRSSCLRSAIRRALIGSGVLVPLYLYSSMSLAQSALPPDVSAGPDRTIADSDGLPGESVQLQGLAESRNVSGSGTLEIVWLNGQTVVAQDDLEPTIRLANGVHQLTLRVEDTCCSSSSSLVSTDLVTITVQAPAAQPPTANAGTDRSIPDSDGIAGETVTLQGSGSSRNAGNSQSLSFVWTAGGQQVATGATPSVRLLDGANQLTLTVTDNCCSSAGSLVTSDTVTITVAAPNNAPVANAGADRSLIDTDGQPGERVTLDASASTDADGTITSYSWLQGDTPLGTGRVLPNVQLADGQNVVTLVVTDSSNNTSSDTVVISVAQPPLRAKLSDVALTPSQKAIARTLDDLCARLVPTLPTITTPSIPPEQVAGIVRALPLVPNALPSTDDLQARCFGILRDPSAANQRKALDELSAQEFNAMRTPTVVFSQTQFQSIMDRLVALRAGERGTSVAGLNLRIGDQVVSLDDLADSLRSALGGGASSDEPGGLLSDRLGFWMRGNYGVGEKSRTQTGIGFDSDQWGVTGGADYRFGQAAVAGVSLGYGKSQIDFTPDSQGGIDTKSLAASLYGSGYIGGLYLDGVINYVDADYDSARHINYLEGTTTIDRTAIGATSGDALSGGVAFGYDFVVGGFTFAPTLGYYHVDTVIDAFTERNADGLNLAFEEQNYKSSTGNAGFRASYAWKTSWGVFIPHFRGAYVREFEDSAEVFGVRFANDPFASAANPTPPIIIESDRIDRSYLRLAAGASAQFPFGISGYFEYQRLEAYEQVQFHDFTIGLRLHRGF